MTEYDTTAEAYNDGMHDGYRIAINEFKQILKRHATYLGVITIDFQTVDAISSILLDSRRKKKRRKK